MGGYILILTMAITVDYYGGGNQMAQPFEVERYSTKEQCEKAAEAWRKNSIVEPREINGAYLVSRGAVCLPENVAEPVESQQGLTFITR